MFEIGEDPIFSSDSKIHIKIKVETVIIIAPYFGGRSHFRVQNKDKSQTPSTDVFFSNFQNHLSTCFIHRLQ